MLKPAGDDLASDLKTSSCRVRQVYPKLCEEKLGNAGALMLSPQIIARNVQLSPDAEQDIRKRTARLSRFYDRLTSCCVTIDVPQRRRLSDAEQ